MSAHAPETNRKKAKVVMSRPSFARLGGRGPSPATSCGSHCGERDADQEGQDQYAAPPRAGDAPDPPALTPSLRHVELKALGHVPFVRVVVDADRTGHDPAHAGGDDGQGVAEEQEDEGLVLGEDLLQAVVDALALALRAGPAPPLEQENLAE